MTKTTLNTMLCRLIILSTNPETTIELDDLLRDLEDAGLA